MLQTGLRKKLLRCSLRTRKVSNFRLNMTLLLLGLPSVIIFSVCFWLLLLRLPVNSHSQGLNLIRTKGCWILFTS
ncbi:hypothetical protein LOK49_LG02G03799 [Camellia lanceoleosa]|uniref:Uncharacterized protein n=1 Tax=Camellia lanceoleosa TaxID=1840588 RepID=A0ACC0IQN8_9ERIC|nr:hypothetical protein LOK49_LG02G03799 [Camellia lanceoleosa]